jgi:uncharacterized protein
MRRLLAIFMLCLLPLVAAAEVEVPALKARVTDLTGTLTPEQSAALESRLAAFEAKKGSQVAVLIVPTTEPEAIEQYGIRVAEAWKLGRKGVDDGALLLVAKNDRTLRIEVGYGLEGALNDATSKRIEDIVVPYFKAGNFYAGVSAGVDAILAVIQGEPLPEPKHGGQRGGVDALDQYFPVLFVVAIVAGAILRSVLGNFMGGVATGGLVGFVVWVLGAGLALALILAFAAFVMTLAGGGGRGFYTGGGWGGGGGFGGGGFSGGGGGFGGGGASGRW